ncbi:late competence development ComFB family protein [Vibrio renipiscarius]|uniref:late competence development ComFB family protein n=1 Tax=Vibrio renipiscarius TaxID=1461322 RepID=UPI00354E5C50
MQISVDVHNYMEVLVGHELAKSEFVDHFDHEQLADLACLTLMQLRPVYIRHDIDFLAALSEERLLKLKQHVSTAVQSALSMITDDRRTLREDQFAVIFPQTRFDDAELEWFEKPIVSK